MTYPNLFPVLPELFIVGMILLILLVDAFSKKGGVFSLSLIALVGAFIIQQYVDRGITQATFNNMFLLDNLATGMKLFTYLFSFVAMVYINRYLHDKQYKVGEFYALFLFAILGMQVMISGDNLLVLYIGLELLSLALYGLVALQRDNVKASEAAMKFFILGSLASGLLLYGISLVYGASGGHLQLEHIVRATLIPANTNQGLMLFGLVFIVAGLVFKLGLVPFHMWLPDVYEGASLATTTIIASVTKIAALIFMIRFLIGGLVMLSLSWIKMILVLAVLSLLFGNIIAIAQTNLKRMLAYSTVAHMGFAVLGLLTLNLDGVSSALFYVISYVLTALAGFGVLTMLSKDNFECENLDDIKGLAKTQPVYAALLSVVMFSLAGIPPFIGFYAKFKILTSLISGGFLYLAIFAVLMSFIGAFYYIRVVKTMYFENALVRLVPASTNFFSRGVLLVNVLLLLIFGIVPTSLMMYCIQLVSG